MSPFYPESIGGAELSTLYIINGLREEGWEVEVISGSSYCENSLGFPCWRGDTSISKLKQIVDQRLSEKIFDIIACQNIGTSGWKHLIMLNYLSQKPSKIFYFARCVDFLMRFRIPIPKNIIPIANSLISASMMQRLTKQKIEIIYPLVDHEQFFSKEKMPLYITFINPVPEKGVIIAIEIAKRLSDSKFLFVMGRWPGRSYGLDKSWIRTIYNLPNVEIIEPQTDMRDVYKVTKILLVPSQFIEMFSRVIIEAHMNSIPVIASNTGGIPSTMGKGGILINPKDDISQYVSTIKRLQTDLDYYEELSLLAFENSKREEFNSQSQFKKLKNCFLEHLDNASSQKNIL